MAATPGSWCGWGGKRVRDGILSPRWLHPLACSIGRKKEPFPNFPAALDEGAMLLVRKVVCQERFNEGEW